MAQKTCNECSRSFKTRKGHERCNVCKLKELDAHQIANFDPVFRGQWSCMTDLVMRHRYLALADLYLNGRLPSEATVSKAGLSTLVCYGGVEARLPSVEVIW